MSDSARPAVLTPDPLNKASLTTPIDRMQAELHQLRSTIKHLGSEVIHLRAQMAKMRDLPVPPDAQVFEPVSKVLTVEPRILSRADSRVASEVAENTPPDQGAQPGPRLVAPGHPTNETDEPIETVVELRGDTGESSASLEPHAMTETTPDVDLVPASERSVEPTPPPRMVAPPPPVAVPVDVRPVIVELDEDPDSAPELFPSEPSSHDEPQPAPAGNAR